MVVRAVLLSIWTRFLDHVVDQLFGGSNEDLVLKVTLLLEPFALFNKLVGLSNLDAGLLLGLLDLHQCRAMLPRQLLEDLRHVVDGHPLVLVVDQLRFMEPEPIVLSLLDSLLGRVEDGIVLGRTVLEGEATSGWWLLICFCMGWCWLWCVL